MIKIIQSLIFDIFESLRLEKKFIVYRIGFEIDWLWNEIMIRN